MIRLFLLMLTLLMFALKLTGVLTWSWWVVWLPIWGTVLVAVVGGMGLMAIVGLAALLVAMVDNATRKDWRR